MCGDLVLLRIPVLPGLRRVLSKGVRLAPEVLDPLSVMRVVQLALELVRCVMSLYG